MNAPKPRAPRQRRKQARPQELLDAALHLFVEKGFAATRAEEVARAAGVSKGTLYLYYPSKEELFKAVVRENLSQLIAHGEELVDQYEGCTSDLLRELLCTWWERFGNTPAAGIHKVVVAEVRNFPDLAQFYSDEVIVPADHLFTRVVERGIARGEFRPLPAHDVAHALCMPMVYLSLHQHSFGACAIHDAPDFEPAALLATQMELMLLGLEVRTPVAIVAATPTPKGRPARRAA